MGQYLCITESVSSCISIYRIIYQSFIFVYYRHFSEAQRETQKYHNLFLVTQERYDKLANLSGSGGASSVKVEYQ